MKLFESAVIIGGANVPTEIFVSQSAGWLNVFGLVIVILLLIPNIIYAVREKDAVNLCTNKVMNLLEQLGRYGCMFLMVFNIGLFEFGFASGAAFLAYLIGNAALLPAYYVFWVFYFKKKTFPRQLALAAIPSLIFLLCGITLRHYLLIAFAAVFSFAHIFVTVKNRV